jgi:hypothetical protein
MSHHQNGGQNDNLLSINPLKMGQSTYIWEQ